MWQREGQPDNSGQVVYKKIEKNRLWGPARGNGAGLEKNRSLGHLLCFLRTLFCGISGHLLEVVSEPAIGIDDRLIVGVRIRIGIDDQRLAAPAGPDLESQECPVTDSVVTVCRDDWLNAKLVPETLYHRICELLCEIGRAHV